jgi:tetratricopeptide (TPR) repeat protein
VVLEWALKMMKHVIQGLILQAAFLLLSGCLCALGARHARRTEAPPSQSQPGDLAVEHIQELIRQKRLDEAAQALRQLAQQDGDNPRIDYWEGVISFQRRNPIVAVLAFRKAERQGLNTVALHISLGLAYYLIHQYFLFQQQMEKAAQLAPSDDEPFYYLGRYFESTRDNFTRALEFFNKALKLKPDNARALYHQGYCLQMLNRREEAEKSYERAIALTAKDGERFSWPYQGMAILLLRKDPQRALDFARKAVELEPGEPSNHVTLARVDEQLGRPLNAIVELEKAAKLDPTNPAPHYSLARLYRKIDNPDEAQTQLKIFQELNAVYEPQ